MVLPFRCMVEKSPACRAAGQAVPSGRPHSGQGWPYSTPRRSYPQAGHWRRRSRMVVRASIANDAAAKKTSAYASVLKAKPGHMGQEQSATSWRGQFWPRGESMRIIPLTPLTPVVGWVPERPRTHNQGHPLARTSTNRRLMGVIGHRVGSSIAVDTSADLHGYAGWWSYGSPGWLRTGDHPGGAAHAVTLTHRTPMYPQLVTSRRLHGDDEPAGGYTQVVSSEYPPGTYAIAQSQATGICTAAAARQHQR